MKPVLKILFHGCLPGICFFLFPAFAFAASADSKAAEGLELYRDQKFDQAAEKFLEARTGKPDDPKISYNLGNSRYKQGNFAEALQDFSSAAGEEKSDPALKQKSIYNMGNAFYRTGKLEESAAAYKKALELDSNDMDAKFNLEFVREQIEKKKQEQQKQKQDKKDQQSGNEQDKNGDPQKDQADSKEPPSPDEQQNQDVSTQQPSRMADAGMTPEEAEQRLDALTEDLKKFQRKQARDMESLFTYQGNDW